MTRKYPKRSEAPLVTIQWYDIQDDDDWNDEGAGDAFYAAHCVSTGWKIFEDKWVLVIARTYSEDEETWSEKRAIPKGCIIDSAETVPAKPLAQPAPSRSKRSR